MTMHADELFCLTRDTFSSILQLSLSFSFFFFIILPGLRSSMLRFCVGDSLSLLRKSLCLKDTVTGCSVRFGDREVSEREGNFSEAILFVIRTENFISGEFVRAYVRCCNFSFLRFAEEN